jgi:hypothetical protein
MFTNSIKAHVAKIIIFSIAVVDDVGWSERNWVEAKTRELKRIFEKIKTENFNEKLKIYHRTIKFCPEGKCAD